MRRGVIHAVTSALVMAIAGTSIARADGTKFEITPFVGQMAGGEFEDTTTGGDRDVENDLDYGLFFNVNAGSPDRQYEMFYAQQGTSVEGAVPIDIDIQYLHVGGIVNFTDVQPVVPFFGITIGATKFSPDATGLDDETKFSVSVGGGLKYKFTDHFGLRLDLRAFVSMLDTDGGFLCASTPAGAGCAITASSDTFVQYHGSLGFIAAF
ncbi:opacity protein-like surface antigen [Povalibacter uvarum]|uniref:Opacity protein-like surface antigen n=1 Tax=Povalibacter uvarum TaxID=732238 RepID=A0A841HQZ3_9GAMM|nr:outer membrane beta-barrel protein [Povalibacter uvarum]MBB6094518.1 opacity protein-like surface antigen [Povalibacter uvarum]